MAILVSPGWAARSLSVLILLLTLSQSRAFCAAPQTSPQFDDLAARAAAAREKQDVPLAIQLYTQASQLNPDWKEGWWYLGVLQYSSNQYAGAIDAFSHLLQLAPTSVPALALRGLCEFETEAYADSLRDLELAMAHGAASDPRNEQIIRFHLAQLLVHAGRFQEALEQYRFFATNHINAPDLMIGISLAGMRIPSFPKDVPPENRELYQAAGEAGFVFLSGDGDKADDLFAQLLSNYPATPNLHFFYGFLLFAQHPELAVEQFRRELLINPDNEEANALFAFTLVIGGQFAEALEPAKRAYTAAPDMELAQIAFGRALAETGDTKRGVELLEQVIDHDPNNVEAHLGLVSVYSRTGDRERLADEREICRNLAR
jgi:tetratricopeptide (TPR) repeat protein